jgi:3-oxoacyl-[acyl-carrier protein] reductase
MSDRRVALITLAGSYVGPALARRLASSEHDFVLHLPAADGRLMSGGDAPDLVAELEATGSSVEVVRDADLTTAAGNEALVQRALDRFGRLDAACFVTGAIITKRFLNTDEAMWDRVKRVNLDMVFHALQAVLPPMVQAGRGQVVVFTSATGSRPEPGVSIYSATRAGANALVRAVGLEFAHTGVTVNAIGTNFMDFPGFRQATGADDPERRKVIEAQVPMKRLGTMDELAEFTVVLLDGRTRFQTGQFFSFSGGWST